MKKYEFTGECKEFGGSVTLHRIRAIRDFADVRAGETGGYIESENNLSHNGNAWVGGEAKVFGEAWVYGDARVSGRAIVHGTARIYDSAVVTGFAVIGGSVRISNTAVVRKQAIIRGPAWFGGNARISQNGDYACVYPVAKDGLVLTGYLNDEGEVEIREFPEFRGTADEFRTYALNRYGTGKDLKECFAAVRFIEVHLLD